MMAESDHRTEVLDYSSIWKVQIKQFEISGYKKFPDKTLKIREDFFKCLKNEHFSVPDKCTFQETADKV